MAKATYPTNKTTRSKSSKAKKPSTKTVSKKSVQKTDVSEIRALEEQLAHRDAELAILNSIQIALASKLDFQGIIDVVGEKIGEIFKDGNVGFAFLDKARGVITFPYIIENGRRIEYFELALAQSGLMQHILKRRRPVVINSKFGERFEGIGTFNYPGRDQRDLKSWVTVPIFNGDEIIGGISLRSWKRENAFTDSDVNFLQTIANSMSVALENARLLKETEQRATELQVINNIGQTLTEGLDLQSTLERVGDRLREALKVESIGIIANDIRTGLVISVFVYLKGKRVIPDRYSLSKNMLFMRFVERMGGKPVVINTNVEKNWRKFLADSPEWAEIPKAFVMVPLLAGGELVGSITIPDYEREDAFTDLPINMLETIASNMGTAIQNVRLFDETQRLLKETEQRATELQVINNIGQTLTDDLDLNNTIERVGERLHETLKFENFGIVAYDTQTELATSLYLVRNGKRVDPKNFLSDKYRLAMRLASRREGKPWVVNTNAEKYWIKFGTVLDDEIAKSFVMFPLLAGRDLVGSITIADYERENAFVDFPISLIETIASNIGTVVQNVRLFDETQHLLKETEQRATELQIINNIGQTLTEGFDLQNTLERVGERLREALEVKSIAIVAFDAQAGLAISNYMYHYGRRIIPEHFSMNNYKLSMRFASKVGSKPWVVNDNVEKYWKKFLRDIVPEWTKIPKAFVVVPLLAGGELVGSITISDYEEENAFRDLPINLLETIASNMGTAIQNVRLFDETKRLFEEAEESRASAERANKAKSTFLANMSHELRTPLNAIIGFTRIVKKKAEGTLPEKQIENLDKVLISSEHLLGLINTVLDIAKIEAGRMDVVPSKFNLSTLTDQCATLATPLLKPNVTLEKQADETLGLIFSDQDKIKQIVLNLLSNAAKFTHTGKILLSVQKINDENVSISVTDSGIGISEEALSRIFEEFQQADTSTTREYGGTGLGLAISRNLARLLGGDLTATSELGKGSTFTLTVPIQYGQKPAALRQAQDSASLDAKPDSTQSVESKADDGATKQNGSRAAMKTILIVEDTEFNIDFLTQLLNDDYHLLIARDGAQGISMAQENNPDLILMDISLPIMDGYEATRRIRETKISVPIIGLSAHAMSGDEEKAKEAGCNDYLTKPVDEVLLIQKLNQYLR
jgi:signal transduction histidine kinase